LGLNRGVINKSSGIKLSRVHKTHLNQSGFYFLREELGRMRRENDDMQQRIKELSKKV
jgi:hypothetical protein